VHLQQELISLSFKKLDKVGFRNRVLNIFLARRLLKKGNIFCGIPEYIKYLI